MTLYQLVKASGCDYDTYDTEMNAEVTVCSFDEEDEQSEDYYEKFRIGIMKFVEVVDNSATHWGINCKWTEMIEHNISVFKEFTRKNWRNQYEDDEDEFIFQWIYEINQWSAGNCWESVYKDFVENYMSRME